MLARYLCAASAAFNFICVVIYFPSKPPQPPSISAAGPLASSATKTKTTHICVSLRPCQCELRHALRQAASSFLRAKPNLRHPGDVLRHYRRLVRRPPLSSYAPSLLFHASPNHHMPPVLRLSYSGWSALESPNLSSFGVTEGSAGILSAASIFVAAVIAVVLGGYTYRRKNHKQTLVVLLLVGLVAAVVWSLMHLRIIPLLPRAIDNIALLSVLSLLIAVGFYRSISRFKIKIAIFSHIPQLHSYFF